MGSSRPLTARHILAYGWLCAALGGAACTAKRTPPVTVVDLMEDRVTLDGVLFKCNADPDRARTDADCLAARIAIERLAKDEDPAEQAKRNAEFERSREKLRLAQERLRQEEEAKTQVDPYSLPLVRVDQAPPGGQASAAPAGASATSPSGAPPGLPNGKP